MEEVFCCVSGSFKVKILVCVIKKKKKKKVSVIENPCKFVFDQKDMHKMLNSDTFVFHYSARLNGLNFTK